MKSFFTIACGVLAATTGLAASVKRQDDGSFSLEDTVDGHFLWKDGYESLTKPIKVERKAPPKKEFTVLTNNLWHQGTQVNGYKEKQVAWFNESGADIVALQETSEERTSELAKSLNWNSWSHDDHGFITRYPIVKRYGENDHGGAVSVALDDNTRVHAWVAHLSYDPYGPYNFCFEGMSKEEVIKGEEDSGRGPEIREIIGLMKDDLDNADNEPVLLMGDFNAPSHLDWTDENRHCDTGAVEWPTSKVPIDAGMQDSLRVVHPDPKEYPALTWSPVYKDNEGKKEPQDRLDFVYHKGGLTAIEAEMTMSEDKPKEMPDHEDNKWTSDHQAVKVKYSFK